MRKKIIKMLSLSKNGGSDTSSTSSIVSYDEVLAGDFPSRSSSSLSDEHREEAATAAKLQATINGAMSFQSMDGRSIYVGNVDYSATAADVENLFIGCGEIMRVTIRSNFMGQPKGYGYVEFRDKSSVQLAMALNNKQFKGRQIKVVPKRTNIPGLKATSAYPRPLAQNSFRGRGFGRTNLPGLKVINGYPRPLPQNSFRGRGSGRSRGRGAYQWRSSSYTPY